MRRPSFSAFIRILQHEQRRSPDSNERPLPSFLLDNKVTAYGFARAIGVRTPDVLSFDRKLWQIEIDPPCVIKPMGEDSARGVFVCKSPGEIFEVQSATVFSSLDEMKAKARALMQARVVKSNSWMSERMILDDQGDMAKDVKFYCFYGKAPLMLETRREPGIARCWYDDSGTVCDTGKYADQLFPGTGYESAARSLAERVSLHIPSPFIRVDLLLGHEGICLGELTPVPGGYARFNDQTDAWLGKEIIAATARLSRDLAYGKTFMDFGGLSTG